MLWEALSYGVDGQLEKETFGNGVVSIREFYPTNRRLRSIITFKDAASILEKTEYNYFANGNVLSRKHTFFPGNTLDTFQYDSLNRLRRWRTSSQRTLDLEYLYTDAGDLRRVNEHVRNGASGQYEEYTFSATHPQRIASFRDRTGASHSYEYDQYGRIRAGFLGKSDESLEYLPIDLPYYMFGGGRPFGVFYGPFGGRVFKQDSSDTASWYFDDLFEWRYPGGSVAHVFAGDREVAQIKFNSQGGRSVSYLHDDQLHSASSVSDAAGAAASRLFYTPFGGRMSRAGAPLLDNPANTSQGGNGINRGFTGHEHDDERALINMKGRLYSPTLHRFLTPDPLTAINLRTPVQCLLKPCESTPHDAVSPPPASHGLGASRGDDELSPVAGDHSLSFAHRDVSEGLLSGSFRQRSDVWRNVSTAGRKQSPTAGSRSNSGRAGQRAVHWSVDAFGSRLQSLQLRREQPAALHRPIRFRTVHRRADCDHHRPGHGVYGVRLRYR